MDCTRHWKNKQLVDGKYQQRQKSNAPDAMIKNAICTQSKQS